MIDFAQPQLGTVVRLHELANNLGFQEPEFVIERVFHGGMGVCLKLRHVVSKSAVALKAIKPEFVGDQQAWGRFIEELKLWFTVSACDGIAEALCIVRVNELPCMCAVWMEQGNLRAHLQTGPREFIFHTLLRVIGALDWAHTKHRIIHRDLKPENILLDEHSNAYVSDWGLARPLGHILEEVQKALPTAKSVRPELTQAGQFLGTVLYAAPEQILGSPMIDHRADIYSLGCLMYEFECGSPPFVGATVLEIAKEHLYAAPKKLGGMFNSTKLGLEKVIGQCLEKHPDRRFQSYQELATEVLRVANNRGVKATPYVPRERYYRPEIGKDEFTVRFQQPEMFNKKGYALFPLKEVDAYFAEASSLMALGRYEEAAKILAPLYHPEVGRDTKQWHLGHTIAIDYALCLSESKRQQDDAITVFEGLAAVHGKPPEFYINYSLALIRRQSFAHAEMVTSEGLARYPNDPDLLGNELLAQKGQRKFSEALRTAQKRLALGRSLPALQEVALLYQELGNECRWNDWPTAAAYFKGAANLIREAITLNPRNMKARFIHAQVLQRLFQFDAALEEAHTVFQNAEQRELGEAAVSLVAEILFEMYDYEGCISIANRWLKDLKFDHIAIRIKRSRSCALVDGSMIGQERGGQRVIVPEAVEFFETVVRDGSSEPDDMIYLARIYEWLDRADEALAILKSLDGQRYWRIPCCRAEILIRQGFVGGAIEAAREAARLAPYRHDPFHILAFIYEQAGDHTQASASRVEADRLFQQEQSLARLDA